MSREAEQRRRMAERIREARTLAGLSQGQVAKMMGMHRPSISEIEAGNRRVSADELARFADLLDVSTAYLLGETPDALSLDDPSYSWQHANWPSFRPRPSKGCCGRWPRFVPIATTRRRADSGQPAFVGP